MLLDRAGQRELLRALDELKGGSSRRFEDRLWLGFGDQWTHLEAMLLKDGCIREVAGEARAFALLVRGEALRLRLEESLRSKSEGSGTGVGIGVAIEAGRA